MVLQKVLWRPVRSFSLHSGLGREGLTALQIFTRKYARRWNKFMIVINSLNAKVDIIWLVSIRWQLRLSHQYANYSVKFENEKWHTLNDRSAEQCHVYGLICRIYVESNIVNVTGCKTRSYGTIQNGKGSYEFTVRILFQGSFWNVCFFIAYIIHKKK